MEKPRRNPTINDVAKRAGVSKSLVSLVMRNSPNVSDERRAAVLEAAKELRYRPNAMARGLVSQRTFVLGFVISDLHNPFFADVAAGLEEVASARGYRVLYGAGFHDQAREVVALDTLLQLRVDGVILGGLLGEVSSFEAAAGLVPTVLVGASTRSDALDSIANDDFLGAQMVVDHLVSLGHTSIHHIDGGSAAGAGRRRQGYLEAMSAHELTDSARVVAGRFTEEGGASGMRQLLDGNRPSAVFAPNDSAALGALEVIDRAGLGVPAEISVVGYNDIHAASHERFSLTTVRQPSEKIGARAVEMLIERIEEGRTESKHELLAPELVVRSTTGPVQQ